MESYEVDEDQLSYCFTLKEAYWSDGTKITAFDFERSWKRALSQPSPNTPLFFVFDGAKEAFEGNVPMESVGIKAINDRALEVKLAKRYPPFLQLLTQSAFFPYKIDEKSGIPLSSGSYQITKLERMGVIELSERNRTSPVVIEFHWTPDEMTALHLFQMKELDFLGLPFSKIPSDLSLEIKETACITDLLASYALLVNPAHPSLHSLEKRKAIKEAIEKIDWRDLSDLEISSNTDHIIPSLTRTFEKERRISTVQAKTLSFERELVLLSPMGSLNRKIAQVIEERLQRAGIHVKIRMVDNKGYYNEMRGGNFDLCITWFSIQYPSPYSILGRFTEYSFQRQLFPLKHPLFDRYYKLALKAQDGKEQEALLTKAEETLLSEAICIPLFTPATVTFISPEWNVGFSPSGFADLSTLSRASSSSD